MQSNLYLLKKIFKKHEKVIIFLIWLLIPSILVYQYGNKIVSGFGLTFMGAFLSTLFVFVFIEYSMLLEKERKWGKKKEYVFYVLEESASKFIRNFIEINEMENCTPEIYEKEEMWLELILNDNVGRKLNEYIGTLNPDYWFKYESSFVKDYNVSQIEKIFEQLISLDVEKEELIDAMCEFLKEKESVKYLIGFGDYSSCSDGNEHKEAIEKMLLKCINIYNLTLDRS